MKIEVAKMHEVAVYKAINALNDAIINAKAAGCMVELQTVITPSEPMTLLDAVVKVHPADIEA